MLVKEVNAGKRWKNIQNKDKDPTQQLMEQDECDATLSLLSPDSLHSQDSREALSPADDFKDASQPTKRSSSRLASKGSSSKKSRRKRQPPRQRPPMRPSHATSSKSSRKMQNVSIDYNSCYDPFAFNEDYAIHACCSAYATNTIFNSDYQESICLYVAETYGSNS